MYMELLIYGGFVLGFVFLIKGADMLVEGASAIAKRLKISDLAIGLTIVSFGTSAPELAVNVIASFEGNANLAIGNIVGSNIANILLILGIASVIYPLSVQKNTVWKEVPLSILSAIMLLILANDVLLDGESSSILSRIDGLVLIAFFIIFLYYTYEISQQGGDTLEGEVHEMSLGKAILYTVIGLAALPVGGNWIVNGGVHLAKTMGLSESMIGLSIIAVGTSLPEVAASAVASYKRKSDIAIGNAVGSNIFNIFWVLGLSSMIKPIPFEIANNTDILMAVAASLILFIALMIEKRHRVERRDGVIFLLLYVGYIGFLIYRG